jgi:hypothetical protein
MILIKKNVCNMYEIEYSDVTDEKIFANVCLSTQRMNIVRPTITDVI